MKLTAVTSVFVISIFLAACQPQPLNNTNQAAAGSSSVAWDEHVEQYLTGYFAANPTFAVYQGKHEFDGKLPDWSEEGLKKQIDFLKEHRQKSLAFQDDQLDERQVFERDYMVAQIDGDLFWREIADLPHTNPYFYAGALDPDVYVSRPYAPLETRIKAYTEYARNVPAALEQVKKNLKLPLALPLVKIARTTIGGLAGSYETDIAKVFSEVKDEASQKEFAEANSAAAKAVRDFDAWLVEQEKTSTQNFALGPDRFKQMLKQTEGVDIDLAELERIARADLDRNLAAVKAECDKYAPGMTLVECNTKANAVKAEGADLIDAATKQLAELRQFVIEKDIVSVPGTEECKVAKAPPYKSWNFAYIEIPGPYETGLPSVYYIAPPDPSWPKEKQDAYVPGKGSLLFTSVHEGYPGHFLNFLHSNRAQSKFGQVFVGYAFAEGYAHYTEEMMYEAGLGADDPVLHLGQLQEALLRNVRFISTIGLHTKGMTVEESKKLFIEQGLQDEGNAEQQANRGTFDPAYLNYTMGKLMIKKLREDWTAARGGRGAWKQFHDTFLSYGGPPIPMVRKAMMGKDDSGPIF
jgi:uncharacterized protein (DUF885 family)